MKIRKVTRRIRTKRMREKEKGIEEDFRMKKEKETDQRKRKEKNEDKYLCKKRKKKKTM